MLTGQQICAYLHRLGFDKAPKPTKENLDDLIYAHQTRIPFETLRVHRGAKPPDLSFESIFRTVIDDGRGGYCFELNKLFEALLATLGYDVRPALSRAVRGRPGRMPLNHRGLLALLDEGCFSADVGFGGPMPAGALKLEAGVEQDIRGEIYIAERCDHAWWRIDRITQAERDLHDDSVPIRRQTELEVCTASVEDIDFEALNLGCFQPGTLHRDHDVANLRTERGHRSYMDGVLTIRENGVKQTIELPTEAEQTAALKEHFGIIC